MKKWKKVLVALFATVSLATASGIINNTADASVTGASAWLRERGTGANIEHQARASATVVSSGGGIQSHVLIVATGRIDRSSTWSTGNAGVQVVADTTWARGQMGGLQGIFSVR